MAIQWFSRKENELIVTIYDSNITLNKVASDYFKTAYSVMLGFEEASNTVLVRPLDKEASRLGHIPEDQRNSISVWQSSARIANKAFISNISNQTGLQFKKSKAHKFMASWDNAKKVLRINLNEEKR